MGLPEFGNDRSRVPMPSEFLFRLRVPTAMTLPGPMDPILPGLAVLIVPIKGDITWTSKMASIMDQILPLLSILG